jgi:hypothetical protein
MTELSASRKLLAEKVLAAANASEPFPLDGDTRARAIEDWKLCAGDLIPDGSIVELPTGAGGLQEVQLTRSFYRDRIDREHGKRTYQFGIDCIDCADDPKGDCGLEWFYHEAPLTFKELPLRCEAHRKEAGGPARRVKSSPLADMVRDAFARLEGASDETIIADVVDRMEKPLGKDRRKDRVKQALDRLRG